MSLFLSWIKSINKNEVFAFLIGVATILAMVFSGILLYENKPSISIREPKIENLDPQGNCRLYFGFENIGSRSAKKLEGKIIILNKTLDNSPDYYAFLSPVNELPSKTPSSYWDDEGLKLKGDVPPKYIIIEFTYRDSLLFFKKFDQRIYKKWGGVSEGKYYPDFTDITSKDEKDEIDKYLSELK